MASQRPPVLSELVVFMLRPTVLKALTASNMKLRKRSPEEEGPTAPISVAVNSRIAAVTTPKPTTKSPTAR